MVKSDVTYVTYTHPLALAIKNEKYYNVFFDEDGNRKYDPDLGSPYAPAVDYYLPYHFALEPTDSWDASQYILYGILKEL